MTVTTPQAPIGSIDSPADAPSGEDQPGAGGRAPAGQELLVEEELLVEDVSIDGMCGVY